MVQWLELLVAALAAADFLFAALSCLYLVQPAFEAETRPRRVGATALAVVCAGLAAEALLFLSLAPVAMSPARSAAVLLVRGALLASSGFVGLLIWRAQR